MRKITGHVNLVVSKTPCLSCLGAMAQFRALLPEERRMGGLGKGKGLALVAFLVVTSSSLIFFLPAYIFQKIQVYLLFVAAFLLQVAY